MDAEIARLVELIEIWRTLVYPAFEVINQSNLGDGNPGKI